MADSFAISVDVVDASADVPELIAATHKQVELAVRRALSKSARWLRTHSLREIGRELGFKQAALKKRFSVFTQAEKNTVKVWVGLRPLAVHHLGRPHQTPTGVSVGRRQYQGAFISSMKSTAPLVWRRKGRERLPVERVTEKWGPDGLAVVERLEQRVNARFVELFKQELSYAAKHESAK